MRRGHPNYMNQYVRSLGTMIGTVLLIRELSLFAVRLAELICNREV